MTFMTPSVTAMTDGQIDKATDIFRAALRKQRDGLSSESVQQALSSKDFSVGLFDGFCNHSEKFGNIIIRRVEANRYLSSYTVVHNINGHVFAEEHVLREMPQGNSDSVEVIFLKFNIHTTIVEREMEYERHGLKPVDPYTLAFFNGADDSFATDHSNETHWRDIGGNLCMLSVSGSPGGYRTVRVNYLEDEGVRRPGIWFACVSK